jgi:hypothetical protein
MERETAGKRGKTGCMGRQYRLFWNKQYTELAKVQLAIPKANELLSFFLCDILHYVPKSYLDLLVH